LKRKAGVAGAIATLNSGSFPARLVTGTLRPSKKEKAEIRLVESGTHAVVTLGNKLYDPNDWAGLYGPEWLDYSKGPNRGKPNSLVKGAHLFERPLLEREHNFQMDGPGTCNAASLKMMQILNKDALKGEKYLKSVSKEALYSTPIGEVDFEAALKDAAAGSGAGGGSVTRGGIENAESGV